MSFKIEPAGKGSLALESALSSYENQDTQKASQPNLGGVNSSSGGCSGGSCGCSQQAKKCQDGACDCCG